MIQSSSEFSNGIITASSAYSGNPDELWTGIYDFALIGTSWDKRCTAVTKCNNLEFRSSILLKPLTDEPSELLNAQHSQVVEFCEANSVSCHIMQANTGKLHETLEAIRAIFWAEIGREDRKEPAKVFIDVSTCPRYFSLALLGEAFRSGLVGEICLGYSEGKYPEAAPSYQDLEEISFTDGTLQAVPIPGFYGEFEPSKGKLFLVSLGFEGWKTLNLLIRKEPERVAALLASPGCAPGYEARARSANSALIERFGIADEQIMKATAGDAVEAWRSLTEAAVEDFDKENVYYLCAGNKPHSIALALRAISLELPTLLYSRPTKHLPVNVDFNGVYWMYNVKPLAGTVLG